MLFRTLGCKQNQFDTQALRHRFLKYGWLETGEITKADWIVVNTCAVTERAVAKARGEIGKLRRLNPQAKFVALGCGVLHKPDDFREVDYLGSIPDDLKQLDPIRKSIPVQPDDPLAPPHGFIPSGRSRGLLRIQSGCDQHCAYCIVPQLRGPSRSVSSEECVGAFRDLVAQGAVEVVLTGTNTALWGKDLPGTQEFKYLLEALIPKCNGARIRLSSLEPQSISIEFLEWCVSQPQICRHFHIALQSGSARIRALMNRADNGSAVLRELCSFKAKYPDVSLGADVIVGFPGETEEDFQDSAEYIKSVPFSYLHVFPFSERNNTDAPHFKDKIPTAEKLVRANKIKNIDLELRGQFQSLNSGIIQDIVTTFTNRKNRWEGLTDNYLKVKSKGDRVLPASRFTAQVELFENRMYVTAISMKT
ncbi:MAG: MiaB/RimO family radical SAM methylthiotransferase [bacterium]|nr:MiaB/RimO family radical SAM methylthiotransferase [bacterium]